MNYLARCSEIEISYLVDQSANILQLMWIDLQILWCDVKIAFYS